MGQGDMSPNIYEGVDIYGNVPQYFRFILSSNNNNCCLLYFNENIVFSFTKKLNLPGDFVSRPSTRATPGTPLGDFCPQTLSLLFCPQIIL